MFHESYDNGIEEDCDNKKETKYHKGVPTRNVNYPEYIKEINELKNIYKDRISIKTGLEFGIQSHTISQYEELLKVAKNYKNYSVLGHLDLVARYDVGNGKTPLKFNQIKPIITEILKTVIEDGKGIELNTSYHRYGLSDSTPSYDILKLYHQLGGKIITIGSDSHKPDHLGAYIEESKDYLKKIGFTEYCTFDQMKPLYHKL